MNYNIKDYVSVYKIDENLLKKMTNGILESKRKKEEDWNKHSYTKPSSGEAIQFDWEFDVCDLYLTLGEELSNEIMKFIWERLQSYCVETSDKLCLDAKKVDLGWSGFTVPRVNWYDKETKMNEHFDHITSIFDGQRKGIPTFTILGLIKNADEGGEFCMWGDEILDVNAGDVLIFPSNFMYRHKVNEITRGERISFVSWAWS